MFATHGNEHRRAALAIGARGAVRALRGALAVRAAAEQVGFAGPQRGDEESGAARDEGAGRVLQDGRRALPGEAEAVSAGRGGGA